MRAGVEGVCGEKHMNGEWGKALPGPMVRKGREGRKGRKRQGRKLKSGCMFPAPTVIGSTALGKLLSSEPALSEIQGYVIKMFLPATFKK